MSERINIFGRISGNFLLLILFTILIIFMGALTSILLFTYNATTHIIQDNQRNIFINKQLNEEIIDNTREIPLQNRMLLENLSSVVNLLGINFGAESQYLDREYQQYIQANKTFTYLNQSVNEIKALLSNKSLQSNIIFYFYVI
jgi:hypothetical protein